MESRIINGAATIINGATEPSFPQTSRFFHLLLKTGQIDLTQFGVDPSKCKHFTTICVGP
ncbi:hypothetical protein Lser_V15G35369 [Lactuca serriola]